MSCSFSCCSFFWLLICLYEFDYFCLFLCIGFLLSCHKLRSYKKFVLVVYLKKNQGKQKKSDLTKCIRSFRLFRLDKFLRRPIVLFNLETDAYAFHSSLRSYNCSFLFGKFSAMANREPSISCLTSILSNFQI